MGNPTNSPNTRQLIELDYVLTCLCRRRCTFTVVVLHLYLLLEDCRYRGNPVYCKIFSGGIYAKSFI